MKTKDINYLVNTHLQPDHLQGLLFLLENFAIGQAWNNGEEATGPDLAKKFHSPAPRG
jgi:glyoxylase-like metal-dependent hydrolase (beta-lactamase superfamily II)